MALRNNDLCPECTCGWKELTEALREDDESPASFLRDLAGRLRYVPVTYEVDGGDIDRLHWIASLIEGADV